MRSSSDGATADLDHVVRLVEQHLDDPQPKARPRAATTVLLLRPAGDEGHEVFLLHRASSMAFAPSKAVFPGGSVDAADADVRRVRHEGLEGWAERLGSTVDGVRPLLVAAAREVFEETGLLLAVDAAGEVVVNRPDAGLRLDLVAGRLSMDEVLGDRGLELSTRTLRPWSRWLTPVWSPRRYDTHFFVAMLPAGADVVIRDGGGEAVSTRWSTPRQALSDIASGVMSVLTPTLETLRDLERTPDPWEAALGRDLGQTTFSLDRGAGRTRVLVNHPDGTVREIVTVSR